MLGLKWKHIYGAVIFLFYIMLQVSTFGDATSGDFNDDTEYLIRVEKPIR